MRRLLSGGALAACLTALLVLALGGAAVAYFSAGGSGSAAAAVTQLGAPTIATATPEAGGNVALSWSAVSAPGSSAVRYYVTRDGGNPAGTCAGAANPAAVTACVDSGVAVGEHSYQVTAVWKSWTATGAAKSAKVTGTSGFTITASTTTPAPNASVSLTITAKDANGATMTSYTGNKNLVFAGAEASPNGTKPTVVNTSGTAVAFGSSTTLSFKSGVASVASSKNGLMKLYRSGDTEITATEGTMTTPIPLQVTVGSGAATKFVLTTPSATPSAGATNPVTITAQDTYGNPSGAYTGSKSLVFSGASASPGGNAPTVTSSEGVETAFGTATAIEFDQGVASADGGANGVMRLYKSGSASVKATDGSLTNSTALALTVAAGDPSRFVLTASNTAPAATASTNLTTTAQDVYANTVAAYAGVKEVFFAGAETSPSGSAPTVVDSNGTAVPFGSATALNFKAGVASVSSSKNGLTRIYKAGPSSVTATDGTISTAAPLAFTVAVGSANRVALDGLSASSGAVGSPCFFTCTVSGLGNAKSLAGGAQITDSAGNTVSNLGAKSVKVTVTSGGTIAGSPLATAATGLATTATDFTYTAPASGNYTHTITLASSGYTSATVTVTR